MPQSNDDRLHYSSKPNSSKFTSLAGKSVDDRFLSAVSTFGFDPDQHIPRVSRVNRNRCPDKYETGASFIHANFRNSYNAKVGMFWLVSARSLTYETLKDPNSN